MKSTEECDDKREMLAESVREREMKTATTKKKRRLFKIFRYIWFCVFSENIDDTYS
jgi:hypothetical protein